MFAALSKGIDDGAGLNAFEENAALARWYGLPFVAYEGGPDTFGPDNVAAKKAAQFDPRMKDLVVRYLNNWYGYGFGLFTWFVAGATSYDTAYGTWGLTDDMSKLTTPKVQGIDAVLAAPRTALTAGSPIPSELDARAYAGARRPFTDRFLTGLGDRDSRDYLVRAPAEGHYHVQINVAAGYPGAKVAILVNGTAVSVQDVAATGSDSTFAYLAPVAVQLSLGINVIRLQAAASGFNLKSIRLGK